MQSHGQSYFCHLCLETIPVSQFKPHLATHNQGPFQCIHCSFGGMDSDVVMEHISKHHATDVLQVCVRFYQEGEPLNALHSLFLCDMNRIIPEQCVRQVPSYIYEALDMSGQSSMGSASSVQDLVIADVRGGITNHEETENERFIRELPPSSIFERRIKCPNPNCSYATVTRKNLILHVNVGMCENNENVPEVTSRSSFFGESGKRPLADHNPSVAPKPAKRQRRMTISAVSAPPIDIAPAYVNVSNRFRCGVPSCSRDAFSDARSLMLHIEDSHHGDKYFSCPHCEMVIKDTEFTSEKIVAHYKLHDKQLFKCGTCDFFADTRHNLLKHVQLRHSKSVNEEDIVTIRKDETEARPVAAKPSKVNMMRRHSVASTKRPRLDDNVYKCYHCDYQSEAFEEMNSHNIRVHRNSFQFTCGDCGSGHKTEKGFKIHKSLKNHGEMITHFQLSSEEEGTLQGSEGVARKKPATATTIAASAPPARQEPPKDALEVLRSHYANKIHRQLMYYCEFCPLTFGDWNPIYEHYQAAHKKVFHPTLPPFIIYSCYFCNFNTPRAATLSKHVAECHGNASPLYRLDYMVKCHHCESANTAENIIKHTAECHPGQKPLIRQIMQEVCGLCHYKYKDEEDFKNHFAKAHKSVTNQKLKVHDKLMKRFLNVKVDKAYKCQECKVVLKKYQLRIHEHEKQCVPIEEALRYFCRICHFVSLDYKTAKEHMNNHKSSGLKCNRCSSTFGNCSQLVEHVRAKHRLVDDYLEFLSREYSLEIIFPNGLVISEPQAEAAALKAYHYKSNETTGKEI